MQVGGGGCAEGTGAPHGSEVLLLVPVVLLLGKKKKSPLLRAEGSGSGHSILFRSVVPEDLFCARQGLGHGRHWLWGWSADRC